MENNKNSRKVRRAIAIVKREDGRIAMVERYDEENTYLTLPTGYMFEGRFDMAKESSMKDDQTLKLTEAKELIKCNVMLKSNDAPCMVFCMVDESQNDDDEREGLQGIGEYEYRLTWIDENEVFDRLREAMYFGEKFYAGLDISESSLYTLLAYYMSKS